MADLEAPGSALPPWLFFAHRSILVFVFAFSEIANFSELSSEMSGKNTKPRQRGFELLQEVREKLAARGRTIKHTVVAAQVRERERERERVSESDGEDDDDDDPMSDVEGDRSHARDASLRGQQPLPPSFRGVSSVLRAARPASCVSLVAIC